MILSSYNVLQNARVEHRGGDNVNTDPNPFSERFGLKGQYDDKSLGKTITYIPTRVPAGFTVIFFAGLVSGLLGIGGGVLKVLGMDTMMRLPFKVSTTTSNFMIGVTATASTGILYVAGYVNVLLAAPVAVGVVIGSYAGTKVLVRSKPISIRYVFIVILLLLGVEMIYMGIPH